MAQSDALSTGDKEIAGSMPPGSGNILPWRLNIKYFLRSFSPFRRFKKGSCQFLSKESNRLDMTVIVLTGTIYSEPTNLNA